jgi:hypothetical protein
MKDEVMKPNPDRVQIILGSIAFLGCILFEVFFLLHEFHIANGVCYATILVFSIACLYTGLRRLSRAAKEGVKIAWYKQPWILSSIFTLIWAIVLFISNYARNFG